MKKLLSKLNLRKTWLIKLAIIFAGFLVGWGTFNMIKHQDVGFWQVTTGFFMGLCYVFIEISEGLIKMNKELIKMGRETLSEIEDQIITKIRKEKHGRQTPTISRRTN